LWLAPAIAQKHVTDSLSFLLSSAKKDTTKIRLLTELADAYTAFKPDTALALAEQALFLAQKIKYTEGESKSLNFLGNAFNQIGNYPKALEFYILRLQLEEKRNNLQNIANVFCNIGVVYANQEEYAGALNYYFQADSIMKTNPEGDQNFAQELKYSIALNIGDLYSHRELLDSSFIYFQQSLILAIQQKKNDNIGTSMVGLGEVYLKQKNYDLARGNLKSALPYLEANNSEDLICEASLALANVYQAMNKNDSAKFYANKMLYLAKKDGFLIWYLKASDFLGDYYKKQNKIDSAYQYLQLSWQLHDSISSKDKIRQSQVITSNEQLRQNELAEQKRKAKIERAQQLQLLFIGIFIPAFFLITLLLSRRKIHLRVIRFLGIISLLILFEYLTLLLHPYVLDLTNHTPIYELLIFVAIASILIRAHHRIEHWFIDKLINRRHTLADGIFSVRKVKLKMKKPSE
jgi:tetratricopeptide (TPR) repeat protein